MQHNSRLAFFSVVCTCAFLLVALVGTSVFSTNGDSVRSFLSDAVAQLSSGAPEKQDSRVDVMKPAALQEKSAQSPPSQVSNSPEQPQPEADKISARLWPPSKLPYNFTKYRPGVGAYNSQAEQDRWVDTVLNHAKGLFVLESGAYNGERISNSLFLETERNWECLLVEPNPHLKTEILALNRKCHLFNGGLSLTREITSFDFWLAGMHSGIKERLHVKSHIRDRFTNKKTKRPESESGQMVKVIAAPLHMIMEKIGRKTIDYWSLDTEGSEIDILKGVDFAKIEIGIIGVETNKQILKRKLITYHLERNGFQRITSWYLDDFYANPAYFKARSLQWPPKKVPLMR